MPRSASEKVQLRQFLAREFDLPSEVVKSIVDTARVVKLRKNEALETVQNHKQNLYYVCSGLLRVEAPGANKLPLTVNFGLGGSLLFSPEFFTEISTHPYSILAMKSSVILVIDRQVLSGIFDDSEHFRIFQITLMGMMLKSIAQHNLLLLSNNASESYQLLLAANPEMRKIPVKYLAAYLGIHTNSLSRIRRLLHDS